MYRTGMYRAGISQSGMSRAVVSRVDMSHVGMYRFGIFRFELSRCDSSLKVEPRTLMFGVESVRLNFRVASPRWRGVARFLRG